MFLWVSSCYLQFKSLYIVYLSEIMRLSVERRHCDRNVFCVQVWIPQVSSCSFCKIWTLKVIYYFSIRPTLLEKCMRTHFKDIFGWLPIHNIDCLHRINNNDCGCLAYRCPLSDWQRDDKLIFLRKFISIVFGGLYVAPSILHRC